MTRTLSFSLSGIAVVLLWVGAAKAEATAADRATARSLAREGYWALQDKHYADAVDRFRRADTLVHAPTLTLDWARALIGLGQFVDAQERYELIIREGVDPKAPPSWQRALADAKAELAALKPRLSSVTITVTGSKDARVTIDGVAVPAVAIGVPRPVNPGAHEVAVVAKGYLGRRQAINLAEGEQGSISFALELDSDQQEAPVALLPKTAPVGAPPRVRSHAPSYFAFGAAGVGLVVGGITGSLALGKRSTLKKYCPEPDSCPNEYSHTVNAYHTLGTISGTGFIIGVTGIAAGITLWLLDSRAGASSAQGIVVHPYLGVGSIGAVGNF